LRFRQGHDVVDPITLLITAGHRTAALRRFAAAG
jgi:hypothetical protein